MSGAEVQRLVPERPGAYDVRTMVSPAPFLAPALVRRFLAAAGIAGLLALPPARAEVRFVRRDFPVQPGCTLKIASYRGTINVLASGDTRIHVAIALDPGPVKPEEAERGLKNVQIEFQAEANGVTLKVDNPAETGARFVWNEERRVNLHFEVLVPPACSMDLATRDGSVSVGNLKGRVKASAKKGTIFLRQIDGDVDVSVDGGDIVVSHCGSASLKAVMGNIRVGTISGQADLRSTNGDIDFQHPGGRVFAYADAGDIAIRFPATLGGEATVKTNGGAITARLDPAVRCSVHASSVWGRVHTKLPFVVQSGGDHRKTLVGTLNGGGPVRQIDLLVTTQVVADRFQHPHPAQVRGQLGINCVDGAHGRDQNRGGSMKTWPPLAWNVSKGPPPLRVPTRVFL